MTSYAVSALSACLLHTCQRPVASCGKSGQATGPSGWLARHRIHSVVMTECYNMVLAELGILNSKHLPLGG